MSECHDIHDILDILVVTSVVLGMLTLVVGVGLTAVRDVKDMMRK